MGDTTREDERAAWLALIRLPGVGATGGRALLQHFVYPRRLLVAGDSEWRRAGMPAAACSYLAQRSWRAEIEPDLAWLRHAHHHLITLDDPAYPPLLREISDTPVALFVQGDPALLAQPQLAIVGSRNPSPGGERSAADFAALLSGTGLCITSGMAVGIALR